MSIDLNGVYVLMERVFTLVAVDEERDMDADTGRPPALQRRCGVCVGVLGAGQFGPLQSFEDFAQGFVRTLSLGLLAKNTQERCPGRPVLGMKLLFQEPPRGIACDPHSP